MTRNVSSPAESALKYATLGPLGALSILAALWVALGAFLFGASVPIYLALAALSPTTVTLSMLSGGVIVMAGSGLVAYSAVVFPPHFKMNK